MSSSSFNLAFEVSNCSLIAFRSEKCCEMSRSKRVLEGLFNEFSQVCLYCFLKYPICGVFLIFRPGGMMLLVLYRYNRAVLYVINVNLLFPNDVTCSFLLSSSQ